MIRRALRRTFQHALLLLLALAASCFGPRDAQEPPYLPSAEVPSHVARPPAVEVDTSDDADWLRLSSGEWLRGSIVVLDIERLEFKSTELGTLDVDWGDVVEVRTSRSFTAVLEGLVQVVGTLRVFADDVYLSDGSGTRRLPRDEIYRLVPGTPGESGYWSGDLSLGATARSGNTDQLDLTAKIAVLRRTARSRLPISYAFNYGELEETRSTDNQRFLGRFDRFLGAHLYVTPLGLELFEDRFQNIALRASPYTGLGYLVVDAERVEWSIDAGVGYRYTRYESVAAGMDDDDGSATANLGTSVSWDPTSRVGVELAWNAQIGLEDTTDTNQSAELGVSVDLWGDFDLDLRAGWTRVGRPEPDDDGLLPEKDDFRLIVGLSWGF